MSAGKTPGAPQRQRPAAAQAAHFDASQGAAAYAGCGIVFNRLAQVRGLCALLSSNDDADESVTATVWAADELLSQAQAQLAAALQPLAPAGPGLHAPGAQATANDAEAQAGSGTRPGQAAPLDLTPGGLLTDLLHRAAPTLTDSDLSRLQCLTGEAARLSGHMARLCGGLGCLVSEDDGNTGSFQDANAVASLLWLVEAMTGHAAGLASVASAAQTLAYLRGAQQRQPEGAV